MKNIKPRAISNCLKKYRRARGLKQNEAAKILGLKSASMISRWEKGVCLPNTKNLFKLAALYRTMSDALFSDLITELREDLRKREGKSLNQKTR